MLYILCKIVDLSTMVSSGILCIRELYEINKYINHINKDVDVYIYPYAELGLYYSVQRIVYII